MSLDLPSLAIRPNNYIFIPKPSPESWKAKCKLWHQVQHREETKIWTNNKKLGELTSCSEMQALAQHLGPTLYRAALVQALNTLHVKRIFGKDSPNKDLKLAEIKNLGSWESDEGTSASKNGSCQLSPSWSSCSASSCTRCRGSQSWTARGTCLNRKATNRINCFKMFQTCFKQFLASDLFRKCLTRAPQK